MSFRCEKCKTAQPARSKPNVIVVEWHESQGHRDIKREMKLCDLCAGKGPAVMAQAADMTPPPVLTPEEVKTALANGSKGAAELDKRLAETFTSPLIDSVTLR